MEIDILLRIAIADDCDDLFNWRNDPITVKYSPTGKVEYSDHIRWFEKKIKDKQCLIWIIIDKNNQKVGMIRFDNEEEQNAEISINLNPLFRGMGYGKKSLQKAIELYFKDYPFHKIIAKIYSTNIASLKLFNSVGFKEIKNCSEVKNCFEEINNKEKETQQEQSVKEPSVIMEIDNIAFLSHNYEH